MMAELRTSQPQVTAIRRRSWGLTSGRSRKASYIEGEMTEGGRKAMKRVCWDEAIVPGLLPRTYQYAASRLRSIILTMDQVEGKRRHDFESCI